jgi:hypothetical protein
MSSSFDLDINNYTNNDLVDFFKLPKEHTVSDIELNETVMREQLLKSGNVDKKFKSQIVDFLKRAKEKLMIVKMHLKQEIFDHTTLSKNQKLYSTDYPASKKTESRHLEITERPETEFVHVQTSDFLPGKINPLKTRVISKCLTIDTRFRDNFYKTSSSDFNFNMPLKLNKVVSMQLSSFEIPVSFYGISSSYGNNFLYISVLINYSLFSSNYIINGVSVNKSSTIIFGNIILGKPMNYDVNKVNVCGDAIILKSIPESNEYMKIIPGGTFVEMTKIIKIPDGNYNSDYLVYIINNLIAPKNPKYPSTTNTTPFLNTNSIFNYIQLILDINTGGNNLSSGSGSGKVSIINTLPSYVLPTSNTINYGYAIHSMSLDFTKDINGNTNNLPVSSKIGWNLGYTQEKYTSSTNLSIVHDINNIPNISLVDSIVMVADTIIEPATIRYIYLAIDDYNNSVNDLFLTAYNNSLMSPNVLARISIKGSYFSLLMENDLTVVTEPRVYFGPVDIQKLKVQLYDDFGRILDMNNANYSFCITFKMLHDL